LRWSYIRTRVRRVCGKGKYLRFFFFLCPAQKPLVRVLFRHANNGRDNTPGRMPSPRAGGYRFAFRSAVRSARRSRPRTRRETPGGRQRVFFLSWARANRASAPLTRRDRIATTFYYCLRYGPPRVSCPGPVFSDHPGQPSRIQIDSVRKTRRTRRKRGRTRSSAPGIQTPFYRTKNPHDVCSHLFIIIQYFSEHDLFARRQINFSTVVPM
jgi:hypothetical protein